MSQGVQMGADTPSVRLDRVTKRFGDFTAVREMDLEIPAGQFFTMLGPSGCGKTTTLRMVAGFEDPSEGRVLLSGEDVTSLPAFRRPTNTVFQSYALFPHRNVEQNVAFGLQRQKVDKGEIRRRVGEELERVGLATEARRKPAQLSGGQQQRVGVARALAADPPVMLMDEPFSAVDPIVRDGLQKEFLRLQAELGKTIAFVTHDIDEAIKLGDNVAIFREGGHLAQMGAPQELLDDPADEFVADFVGRDRGFRGLSFLTAEGLEVEPVQSALQQEPRLVLDDDGRPRGWTDGTQRVRPMAGAFRTTDSLRLVTDLAISSPAGLAVRVDDHGVADGVVPHEAVARHLSARRRAAEPDRSRAGR
jgi:osmoprotectant transport system ATP-binding protein